VAKAVAIAEILEKECGLSIGVVNGRFAKPLDKGLLKSQSAEATHFITMEEHAVTGGFGTAVSEALSEMGCLQPVLRIGYPDQFIEHGTSGEDIRSSIGLDIESVTGRIREAIRQPVYTD
jgi:1-deoxy-D-xylulose-5-phosphate synthase